MLPGRREALLDRKLGDAIDNIDVAIKDEEVAKDRAAKPMRLERAETDEAIDEAFRILCASSFLACEAPPRITSW